MTSLEAAEKAAAETAAGRRETSGEISRRKLTLAKDSKEKTGAEEEDVVAEEEEGKAILAVTGKVATDMEEIEEETDVTFGTQRCESDRDCAVRCEGGGVCDERRRGINCWVSISRATSSNLCGWRGTRIKRRLG